MEVGCDGMGENREDRRMGNQRKWIPSLSRKPIASPELQLYRHMISRNHVTGVVLLYILATLFILARAAKARSQWLRARKSQHTYVDSGSDVSKRRRARRATIDGLEDCMMGILMPVSTVVVRAMDHL
uniref:Uncharacterized protein n=1 Tax=Oryza nivara TaxID=4536 RepID=A0A0E0G3D6_ORYNI